MSHPMDHNPAMSGARGPRSRSPPETMTDDTMPMKPQGHMMSATDPDNPQNWFAFKKIYVSAVATMFAWIVAFAATSYTAGINPIMMQFGVSMQVAILGLSLFFWGVAFAPVWTPHVSEKIGRQVFYLAILPIFALFTLGAARSQTFGSLVVCRFFAGLFGGPALVLIEGTFADVWSADFTVTYYGVLTLASFIGTACGPLISGFLVAYGGWRWTQYIVLILVVPIYLFGVGMPDTYPREIIRRRARRAGVPHNLPAAQSGVTLAQMASITIVQPLKMIATDPITMLSSLYVGFVFGTIFQFFIAVPVVLKLTYMFDVQNSGVAFTSAIAGVLIAALTSMLLEIISRSLMAARNAEGRIQIEYRLLPGILGGAAMWASFFWIGFTAKPTVSFYVPIIGTGVFIWGAASVLTSIISYLFDAFPPRGTLSALTAAACFRIIMAGLIPLFIIPMIQNLTGKWAYGTFGFIGIGLWAIPFIFFFFGAKLRGASKAMPNMDMDDMRMGLSRDQGMQMNEMRS